MTIVEVLVLCRAAIPTQNVQLMSQSAAAAPQYNKLPDICQQLSSYIPKRDGDERWALRALWVETFPKTRITSLYESFS